jgi:hypothetical protein
LLKTLEYPNTYTYSATFLTTVGVKLIATLVKLSFSLVIFINLMGELYYAVIMFVYSILSFNKN